MKNKTFLLSSEMLPLQVLICSSASALIIKTCNLNSLSDGMWSQWSEWCKCPTTRSRVRTCRNLFTNATAGDCPGPRHESSNIVMYGKGEGIYYNMRSCNTKGVLASVEGPKRRSSRYEAASKRS